MKSIRVIFGALTFAVVLSSCEEKVSQNIQVKPSEDELPVIELLSPDEDSSFDLREVENVEFSWTPVENVNTYKILLSKSEDMSGAREITATKNPYSVKSETLDGHLKSLGFDYEESADLYWSVIVYGDVDAKNTVRGISLTRCAEEVISNEDRNAEQLVVKVAVVIEDLIVPGTGGKRMHEICALNAPDGYYINGGGWFDPHKQYKEFERDLEAASHNVLDYQIVDIQQAERLFTYHKQEVSTEEKEYVTIDTLLNRYFPNREVDNIFSYDYVGMMKEYGYDKMVDAGELDEIWVYVSPAGGMYESRLIGNGAFWCNSPGLGPAEGAPCEELCCVMCCNYERTTDLALHAYAHRVESIMNQVYGDGGWNYDKKTRVTELTNWEKFSAHNNEYEKFEKNHAHIGMCHWPPNSQADYDYGNGRYVYTYADTWENYPDIKEENPRLVNKNEWKHEGGDQWGYMMWYFGHIPHFKGICPRDSHLNNWWHYIVHYNDALKYERLLQNEM